MTAPAPAAAPTQTRRRRPRMMAAAGPAIIAAVVAAALAAASSPCGVDAAATAFLQYQRPRQSLTRSRAWGGSGGIGSSCLTTPLAAPSPSIANAERQRGRQLAARLSFRVTSRRLFNKVKDFGRRRSPFTSLGGERGRGADIPHDEVTFRRRGPDSAELTTIPQPERYSSIDWIHNINNMPGSQVLQRIRVPIIANMLWALVVSYLFKNLNLQPVPGRVHTLLGSSLGLLLVFRTNTSYGRYWEGRSLWEKLHNKARDLARAVSIYEDCIGAERVTVIGRLICAYPLILREHLTGENHKPELARLLGPQLSDHLDSSTNNNNKPLWLLNRLSVIFRAVPEKGSHFSSRERLMLLGLVNDLSSIIGACERLVQTPVPLSYARHTSRFLTLYLWSLPMVLVADFTGPLLSLVSGFVCWCLFGILEIGLLIEDPFRRILRTSWTSVIADSVIRDVQWSIAENRAAAPTPAPAAAAGGGGGAGAWAATGPPY